MTTSKELREAPPKLLDNYIATFKMLGSAPQTLQDDQFPKNQFVAPGEDLTNERFSYLLKVPIGFSLKINNYTYTTVSITSSGWMILDGLGGTSASNWYEEILQPTWPIYRNNKILSLWRPNHILLAPWFDLNVPLANSVNSLSNSTAYYSTTFTPSVLNDIIEARDTRNWPADAVDCGTRYARTYDENYGNCFISRWTTFLYDKVVSQKRKFEVAIFENGRIEFRYWPCDTNYVVPDFSSIGVYDLGSTVGVFWNGYRENSFRDFAPILGYKNAPREISEFGGSPYDSSYSEDSKPYSSRVNRNLNWPKNGGVIVFSPPVNSSKFLPRKNVQQISITKNITSKAGQFDDRKILNFNENNAAVYMPTSLASRHENEPGDVDSAYRQVLFTNGSIVIPGKSNKSSIDTILAQTDVESNYRKHENLSFNENSKNFDSITSSDDFYSTGSPIEIFGDGFTTPLKSKTQFHLELPVTNPVKMPALTSSMYHYNSKKSTWEMANPSDIRNPEWTSVDTSVEEVETKFYSKVTETAVGFDPVGRRTVLSSDRANIEILGADVETYQRGETIGVVCNSTDTKNNRIAGEAISQIYINSVSDDKNYFPNSGQQISLGNEYPFLIEKIVAEFPVHIYGDWFDDYTTCTRAFYSKAGVAGVYYDGKALGPIDFGGPGITFSISCSRKGNNVYYSDLISSGTITHSFDNKSEVILRIEDGANKIHSLRPEGFKSFSNPTVVIEGQRDPTDSFYEFNRNIRLEMEASVAGGVTYANNMRAPNETEPDFANSNRIEALNLLTMKKTSEFLNISYNTLDVTYSDINEYMQRSPRSYLQQVSPISRGATGINFNGNSILGGSIATLGENNFNNNLFVASTYDELPTSYKNALLSSDFKFDAVSMMSSFKSRPSPYLVLPEDKITISISKTRPVLISYGSPIFDGSYEHYTELYMTGSHSNVYLNTGSIKLTFFGSYVREGEEYNP